MTRRSDPPPGRAPTPPAASKGGTVRMTDAPPSGPRMGKSGTIPLTPNPPPPAPVVRAPATTAVAPPSSRRTLAAEPEPGALTPSILSQLAVTISGHETGTPPHKKTIVGGTSVEGRTEAPIDRIRPGQQVGHFVLDESIGSGNYGQVFKAHDDRLPEFTVAVKIIPVKAQELADIKKELAKLALISHPNVVSLLDHGVCTLETGEQRQEVGWFAMPYYKGKTLAERIHAGPRVDSKTIVAWFEALSNAVKALHESGFRHQDIKPENVFIADFGTRGESVYEIPILLDLGVAVEKEKQDFFAGTIEYWAPEQEYAFQRHRGTRSNAPALPLGPEMDVYSLALTLLYALGALQEFDRALPELKQGKLSWDSTGADRYNECLAQGPLANPRVLPGFRFYPRTRLASRMKSWFAVDPAHRASIDQFALDLELLLGMDQFKASVKRIFPIALAALSLLAMVVLGAAKIIHDRDRDKEVFVGEMSRDFENCLSKSGTAKKNYERIVSDLELCKNIQEETRKSLGTFAGDLGTTEEKIRKCEKEYGDMKGRANKFSHDIETRKREIEDCEGRVTATRAQLATCLGEKQAGEARETALRAQLASAQQKANELTAQLNSCNGALQERTGQLRTSEERRASCEQARTAAELGLTRCHGEQQSCRAELTSCQQNNVPRAMLAGCIQNLAQKTNELLLCQQRPR